MNCFSSKCLPTALPLWSMMFPFSGNLTNLLARRIFVIFSLRKAGGTNKGLILTKSAFSSSVIFTQLGTHHKNERILLKNWKGYTQKDTLGMYPYLHFKTNLETYDND